jgi:hypothetical protein
MMIILNEKYLDTRVQIGSPIKSLIVPEQTSRDGGRDLFIPRKHRPRFIKRVGDGNIKVLGGPFD